MHTPVVAASIIQNCIEFGAYVERKFFLYQPDWFLSATNNADALDVTHIKSFINSVEAGTDLPELTNIEGSLPRGEVQSMGGADLIFKGYIC